MVMNDQQKFEMTAQILRKGKALVPDRFPQPSQETAVAWASALSRMFDRLPSEIWPEVVDVWATELVGDRMITPKELKRAAYTVRDRWEADPVKRGVLEKSREADRELRDRQLADGSFGRVRGYLVPEVEPVRRPDRLPSEYLADVMRGAFQEVR